MLHNRRPSIDISAALAADTEHQPRDMTLSELVRAYDAHTCNANHYRLRKWLDALGGTCAWDITCEQLSVATQAMVSAGYKASTPNRDLSALGSVYRWAIEKRLAPKRFRSPTIGAKRFKEDIRRVHVTEQEIRALRDGSVAYPDRRFGVFVNLLLDSGARKGEVYNRRWSQVDLEKCELLLPTSKNGQPRTMHFSQRTRELILRVYPVRPDIGLLFEGLVPQRPKSYRVAWAKLTKAIGRPDLRLHDSRHIVAAGMLRSGVSLPVAAQAIGNSPAVLAARYGHLETKTLRGAVSSQWSHK
jgi:integrase